MAEAADDLVGQVRSLDLFVRLRTVAQCILEVLPRSADRFSAFMFDELCLILSCCGGDSSRLLIGRMSAEAPGSRDDRPFMQRAHHLAWAGAGRAACPFLLALPRGRP
ncbi:MAG TPA: hypothetical protein VG099_16980 [Gemmataceae bacterium]|jgi:hypothetical protein|nr:hypothetical protein [Gemmataceae bacterium]